VLDPASPLAPAIRRNLQILQYVIYLASRRDVVATTITGMPLDLALETAIADHIPDVVQRFRGAFDALGDRLMGLGGVGAVPPPLPADARSMLAVALSEVGLLHRAVLSQSRMVGAPAMMAPLLRQLGDPVDVYSRAEDALFLLHLVSAEGWLRFWCLCSF
jgi:hypothetical protein